MSIIIELFYLLLNIVLIYLKIITKLIISWFVPQDNKEYFSGKVVVITGSAQGIGRELSLQLHRLGARLALIDINENLNQELVQHLNSKSNNINDVFGYRCDLTNEIEIEDTVGQILLDFGQVDILINNAGYVKCVPLLELSKQDIKRTFNVNVLSHFWLIRQFLPSMIERQSGHIVAISSIAGLTGTANLVDYCASKHAIVGMMAALDCELAAKNYDYIKLTTICPMATMTGMFKKLKTRFNRLLPILSPEHVAMKIVDTIRQEKFLTIIPERMILWILIERIIPRKVVKLVKKFLDYEAGQHSSIDSN